MHLRSGHWVDSQRGMTELWLVMAESWAINYRVGIWGHSLLIIDITISDIAIALIAGKDETIPMLNVNHNKDVQQKIRRQSTGVPAALTVPTTAQSNKSSEAALKTPSSLVPQSMPASARTSIVSELSTNLSDKHTFGKQFAYDWQWFCIRMHFESQIPGS